MDKLGLAAQDPAWPLILSLRLAVLFNLSRAEGPVPPIRLDNRGGECRLVLPLGWAQANPLTQVALADELRAWRTLAPETRLVEVVEA